MFIGSKTFKHVYGGWKPYGVGNTTGLALSAADADSATAVIPRGKLMELPADLTGAYRYGSGKAAGFLQDWFNLLGITGDAGFKGYTIGDQDIPKKRGDTCTIMIPNPDSIWELEGLGTAIVDNLVCTSGAGKLIATNTPEDTALSCLNGCLKLAEPGDLVIARLISANLTPEIGGNRRARIRWVGPQDFVMPTP